MIVMVSPLFDDGFGFPKGIHSASDTGIGTSLARLFATNGCKLLVVLRVCGCSLQSPPPDVISRLVTIPVLLVKVDWDSYISRS